MKKAVGVGLILVLLTASKGWAIPEVAEMVPPPNSLSSASSPIQPIPYMHVPVFEEAKTAALAQYQKRATSEFSKLIYLGDLLKQSNLTVIHAGKSYNPRAIAPMITMYVRMNYKKETAMDWVNKHAYRNGPSYSILYLKDPEGKVTVLRDFLLEELNSL